MKKAIASPKTIQIQRLTSPRDCRTKHAAKRDVPKSVVYMISCNCISKGFAQARAYKLSRKHWIPKYNWPNDRGYHTV